MMAVGCEYDGELWKAVKAQADANWPPRIFEQGPPRAAVIPVAQYDALWMAASAACDKLPGKAGTRSAALYGADGSHCAVIASHSYEDGHDEVWHVEAYDQDRRPRADGTFHPDSITVRVRGPFIDNHDQHWERVLREFDPAKNLVADGRFYTIGSENEHRGARGFGGRRFTFRRLADDSVVESTNMWSGGTIAPAWRDRLPDTAVMIQGQHAVYMG